MWALFCSMSPHLSFPFSGLGIPFCPTSLLSDFSPALLRSLLEGSVFASAIFSWLLLGWATARVPSPTPWVTYTHVTCSSHRIDIPGGSALRSPDQKRFCLEQPVTQHPRTGPVAKSNCQAAEHGDFLMLVLCTPLLGSWGILGAVMAVNLKVTLLLKTNIFGGKD